MTRAALSPLALALVVAACSSPSNGPQAGSQTNWLTLCEASDDCGDLECLCGACSARCDDDDACAELAGASCIDEGEDGAIALCSGRAPPSNLCLPRCDVSCDEGLSCVAGVCVPTPAPTATVTIDTSAERETLVGFGASLAYGEDGIVGSADKSALYDFVFAESGLDVIRIGNRYTGGAGADLSAPSEILAAAAERLGRAPLLFMTSASPPAPLKQSASTSCAGNEDTCMLASLPGGGFDYDGFASFWRTSLEGYASAGIAPDYVGIQNDPDWVPPADAPHDACRFLPEEETRTVTVSGSSVDVAYPGYREALAAVQAAVADLPDVPRFLAPEASAMSLASDYTTALDASSFDALAIHLYDVEASAVEDGAFSALHDLAEPLGHPVFQTEMQADGLETAILLHHSMAVAGASAYVQNDLVSLTREVAPLALVLLTPDGFEPQGPYYALSQFAKHTDPGWIRIETTSDSDDVLASAWIAPDDAALTLVLVNAADADRDAEIALPDAVRSAMTQTQVTRTVFEGVERSAALGALPASGVVRLPGHSVVTIALTAE